MTILLVSAILTVTVVLLVTEVIPVDLTALGVMVALMVTGVLTAREALAGLAHPAPVTVGALFIVSAGLARTGALDLLAARLTAATRDRPRRLLLLVLSFTAVLSAFMNNTPVVVLLISVLVSIAGEHPISLSKFLIPVSFVSILAGTSTLIGTSTNIIISDMSAQLGERAIGMFELSRLGVPLALLGAAFLYVFSFRLLPEHRTPVLSNSRGRAKLYISELLIPPGSPFIGCDPLHGPCSGEDLEIYQVLRDMEVLDPVERPVVVEEGDILLVKASAATLVRLLNQKIAKLPKGDRGTLAAPFDEGALIVELIVPPSSTLVGQRWQETFLAKEPHVHSIGVQRQWVHYPWTKMADLRFAVGDILLVQSPLDHIEQLRADGELIVVEDLQRQLVNRRKAPLAVGIFLGMVALATAGVLDILVAALAAAVLMVGLRCVTLRQAYQAVDVRTLLMIAGTLALGQALQRSGAADLYAATFLSLFAGASPTVVLGAVVAFTSLLSHLLSNNSTAVLATPIALATARALGVSSRPFVMGLCFGASACYATPIGYQTNLLVYGPGGYRFMDFLRLGVPLDIIVILGTTLLVPRLWPF